MTAKTTWPYDADEHDPLTALRIPVTSAYPDWCYLTAFDRDSAERPTDTEAAMLASFNRQYIEYWYSDSYKQTLAERPFDIDGGANGVVFRKWGVDDWGYRRRTWTMGPMFVPQSPAFADRTLGPLSLAQLMDRIHAHGDDEPSPRWTAWKAAHADVFGDPA